MKHSNMPLSRLLSLICALCLLLSLLPIAPTVQAAGRIYYTIDMSQDVLASRVEQRVSGGCAVASMATVEAYLHGARTPDEIESVYQAVLSANTDDNYAYWGNVGYLTSQDSIDWEAVYNQLAQGYPCIIHRPAAGDLGQHWSVVAGYQGSSAVLEPDQFLVVEVNGKAGPGIQTVSQWRGTASVDRYSWRGAGMAITSLSGIRFAINHPPVVKLSGIAHVVGGTIVSDSQITRIQVTVTNVTSGNTVYNKTLAPNTRAYSMSNLDAGMSYSSWGAGCYYLTIHVTNAAGQQSMYGRYFEIAASYPSEKPDPVYELSFDPGSGTGSMDSIMLHLGDSFTLPACAMTNPGSSFTGWNIRRGDGKWMTDGKQWLTDSEISSGNHNKLLFPDKGSGTLDAWWIREAKALCGYTFVARWSSDGETPSEPTEPSKPEVPSVYRISGETRYQTSYAVADALKDARNTETFDNIIIASGLGFADALSGSYLASVKNAPILMTNGRDGNTLAAYITENWSGKGKVYIIGGSLAVPEEVQTALNNAGISTTRLAGDSRFDTNLLILEEAGIGGKEILIASGFDFADALSASATGLPILLVNNVTGKLTDSQVSFLKAHSENIYVIIGGESAISFDLEMSLQSFISPDNEVGRVYGSSREETSVEVAENFITGADLVLLAYSRNFPDGLCGGPLAHALGAPLLLIKDGREAPAAEYVKSRNLSAGIVLGGSSAVPDASIQAVFPD